MIVSKTKKSLSPLMRQVLMHEMFRCCKMIDNNVINQYFPYIDSNSRRIKFPESVKRKIVRDLKDLKDAGVVEYKYREKEEFYASYPCDFTLKIPEKASENKRRHLERLNLICRFVDSINDIEDETCKKESNAQSEMDDTVFEYMLNYDNLLGSDKRPLTDIDLYRYDDPFVSEYIKLSGCVDMEKIKADFELLEQLRYLYYDRIKRRFRACDEYSGFEIRQDFGVVRGNDGLLYI